MVRLNRRDMQLVITQGYKLSEDLFIDLLAAASGVEVDLDKKRINTVIRALGKKKLLPNADVFNIERLILDLKDSVKNLNVSLQFKYVANKKLTSSYYNFEDYGTCNAYSICDFLNREAIEEDIICFDYTRLLDWLAYEIGHGSYDDTLDLKYYDNLLGNLGLLYPAEMDKIDNLIPENFEKEISDLCVDTSVNSQYYVKTSKIAYDYFMHEPVLKSKKKTKYTYYKPLLDSQENYLTYIILFYLMVRANSSVIDFKLLEVQKGKIYFLLGDNKFNKESFKEHLTDAIHVSLLDRKFEFIPKIIYL